MPEKLPNPNPYQVLDVPQAASKAEIIKAVAMAMKLKNYPLDTIASAQKSLTNPKQRLCADYLLPRLSTVMRFKRADLSPLNTPAPTLEFLPEFDGIDEALADVSKFFFLEMFEETDKCRGGRNT